MMGEVQFEPHDGMYLFCVGDGLPFEQVFRGYCFIDRICFANQCNQPEFAKYRERLHSVLQRGIGAGIVRLDAAGGLWLASEVAERFRVYRNAGCNEFDAAEQMDEYLMSRSWPIVSEILLSS